MLYASLESARSDDGYDILSKPNERGDSDEAPPSNSDTSIHLDDNHVELLLFMYGEMSAASNKGTIQTLDDEEFYTYAAMKAPPSILETLSVAKLKEYT